MLFFLYFYFFYIIYLELLMAKLTLGGTLKPNALATFARSSLSTLNIFLRWYVAYACKYDRNASRADWLR
jgi:hypothetical protein